jgi:type IV pilus assembly protein PilB
MADNHTDNVLLLFLLENNYATQEQVDQIVEFAQVNNVDIPTAIRETELVGTQDQILAYIAEASGYEFVKLDQLEFNKEAVNTLEQNQAQKLVAIPYAFEDGALKVAVPIDRIKSVQLKTDLRRLTKNGVLHLVVAQRNEILKAIDTQYRNDAELTALSANAMGSQDNIEDSSSNEIGDEIGGDSDVVRFVDLVLRQGVKDRASDIHFDPQEHGLVIRYRLDGILQPITEAPTFMIPEIVSRIKIMAELDISKTREPQDGRLSIPIGNKIMDFRVATLPSIHGEKIVMRVLDNSAAQLGLEDLGFSQENLERFRTSSKKPYGVLLVTGPTGSGKSTTLYAALNALNSPDVNIITAEDPVEYQLNGITQVPVRHPLTFEKVLRTVLRADPDIVLIGEIRDYETAEIAMKAGMTGHMVFSTLHTNDAATALTRLGDMGVQPFITASTVEAIVSQRLVRRLCAKCKRPGEPTEAELKSIGFEINYERDGEPNWFVPVGCKACNRSGYKGRMAIHEVLVMTETLEEAVIGGAKAFELNKLAIEEGMISLKEDGFRKAAKGLTTLQEIMRVVN